MRENKIQTLLAHSNLCILSIILASKKSGCADYRYEACVPIDCGNGPNISFPFYIPGRQESYCGYPGFTLNCSRTHSSPVLDVPGFGYAVDDIFYGTRSLRVYDPAALSSNDTVCTPLIRNWTSPPTQFDFAENVTRLHLFSDCADNNNSNSNSICGGWDLGLFDGNSNLTSALENCRRNLVAPVENVGWNLSEVLRGGFVLKWRASECGVCEDSGGRCGFNATTFHFRCFCPDRPHARRCRREKSQAWVIAISTVISGGGVFIVCVMIPFIIWKCKKIINKPRHFSRKKSFDPSSESDMEGGNYFGIPVFCYTQLQEATNSFDSSKELGDGGFGTVYYGKLHDGREVAIKRLYKHDYRTMQQFINEIKILTCLRHKNLVSLYGCTSRRSKELLLVYEYVSNGTVAEHLHGQRARKSPLSWPVRMGIAMETAGALSYLHRSDIIHRDVKTDNILLDADFRVKVADFGLSRLFPNHVTHVSTGPQGTPGYVDPEYHRCYRLTDRSDVYSFGVVLVELLSSMPAVDMGRHGDEINLANLALNRIQRRAFEELVDTSIGYECDEEVRRMANSVAELAFRCLQLEKEMRPSMDEVLEFLKEINGGDHESGSEKDDQSGGETKDFHLSPKAVTDVWFSSASTTGSVAFDDEIIGENV